MIDKFNQIIDYIEEHLDSVIEEKKILEMTTYSYAMLGRIFSIMSGFTLGEYIRLRKLSKAAEDLRETNEKVINIAMKYGYSSVEAFSYAFKKYHNQTPLAVRKGAEFNVFPPIRFCITVKGGKKINIKIKRKKKNIIAGLTITNDISYISMELWKRTTQVLKEKGIDKLGNGKCHGVCYENKDENCFCYMIGYDVIEVEKARQLKMEIIEIPDASYAVVELKGSVPECIHEGWEYVTDTFFPQGKYRHAGTPDFELYSEGNMRDANYKMELWIPIEKDEK